MSWKTIVVKETNKISLYKNQFAFVKDKETILIPFQDVDCIILEKNYTYITSQLLSKLAENNIFLLVCNEQHDPNGVFLPFNNHWKPLEVFNLQIAMGVHFKKQIWTKIIGRKILNSALILEKLDYLPSEVKKVKNLIKKMLYNDAENVEGQAASIFFRCLYGSSFVRDTDTGINAALNYGYKILLSAVTRSCAQYGLHTTLGVWHHNKENMFNLSSDLMEPLRPVVDLFVKQMGENIHDSLTYNHRLELIKILHFRVLFDSELRTVSDAIEKMVKSFVSSLKTGDSSDLLLPKIIIEENKYCTDSEW